MKRVWFLLQAVFTNLFQVSERLLRVYNKYASLLKIIMIFNMKVKRVIRICLSIKNLLLTCVAFSFTQSWIACFYPNILVNQFTKIRIGAKYKRLTKPSIGSHAPYLPRKKNMWYVDRVCTTDCWLGLCCKSWSYFLKYNY